MFAKCFTSQVIDISMEDFTDHPIFSNDQWQLGKARHHGCACSDTLLWIADAPWCCVWRVCTCMYTHAGSSHTYIAQTFLSKLIYLCFWRQLESWFVIVIWIVCVCVCVGIPACMFASLYVYVYANVYVYVSVSTCVCLYVCACVFVSTYPSVCVSVCP